MGNSFSHTVMGKTGLKVFRLGLSAVYRPGVRSINMAIDQGVNFIFYYNFDGHMIRALRQSLHGRRDKMILSTGAYNFKWWKPNLKRVVHRRLRQLKTDYIDILYYLGAKSESEFNDDLLEQFSRLKEEGKIRFTGISSHNRKLAGKLANDGVVDVYMIRYNAAHRGAESDIFPYLEKHDPGLVSYTATRWRFLLKRPSGWPESEQVPDASMAYRFVLSNPHVHLALTAPSKEQYLKDNLKALEAGPLSDDEMEFMRRFGDAVYKGYNRGWE